MRILLSLVFVLALAGCGGGAKVVGGADSVSVLSNAALPEPEPADAVSEVRPYLIGPFDKLSIDVFGIEELSQREVQADASGRISFPLAGIVEAAGKTPGELEKEIEKRLKTRYIRDPLVTVNLREIVGQLITVDGQVKEPGVFPVVGKMTLMGAIAKAKGTTDVATTKNVLIFRTVKGQKYAAAYNLDAIRHANYDDPEVFANDIIVVDESRAKRLFKDLTPLALTPLAIILQRL